MILCLFYMLIKRFLLKQKLNGHIIYIQYYLWCDSGYTVTAFVYARASFNANSDTTNTFHKWIHYKEKHPFVFSVSGRNTHSQYDIKISLQLLSVHHF